MDHTKSDSLIAIQELEKFYEKLFPYKSEFELWDNLLCNASENLLYKVGYVFPMVIWSEFRMGE